MDSKTNRYQSRILREMHQHNENPFSPPSSTGSHGTVTLTSNISLGPQGESTRRMDNNSIRFPNNAAMRNSKAQPSTLNINTSALGRTFPEWNRWNLNDTEHEKDMWEIASDASPVLEGNENMTPLGSPSPLAITPSKGDDFDEESQLEALKPAKVSKDPTPKAARKYLRTRAQMQPHVQNESECSLDLSESFAQPQHLNEKAGRSRESTPNSAKDSKPRRGNVTALLETLKTAQIKQAESQEQSAKQASPQPRSSAQPRNAAKLHMERQAGMSSLASPSTPNQTARSFYLPSFTHVNDFLSGVLKLSSLRNGMPVFVKHGRVHDRESSTSPEHHAELEAVSIPEDEEKIFVSLDKIKDEVHALKDHDEFISKQAEQLQEEVDELHIQIAKFKSRKDSAVGSDSESSVIDHLSSQKSQLEEQVNVLQGRLDKANRKISINEIHTESYIAERDEALKNVGEHLETIKHLQSELNAARQQLQMAQGSNVQGDQTLELENNSLRKDNNTIRQQWKSMLEENRSLRAYNSDMSQQNEALQEELRAANAQLDTNKTQIETLQREYKALAEEKAIIKQDNLSLEHHNDKFFNDNKVLKQQNSLLDRRTHDLQDDVARLQKLLDATSAETGTMSTDFKDIKYRLEVQNREIANENAELHQQIIDMGAEFSSRRMAFDQEKRRLTTANRRLTEQINKISDRFELIAQESKQEAARYEDQQAALTQQLELIAGKESALAEKLKKSVNHETVLQTELGRRNDAISEARQTTQEIKDFMNAVSKSKSAKTTRVTESKGKPAASETTARSITSQSDMPIQDDYTQQIDLTHGSDYASIFTQDEMPKLRDALRQIRQETQTQDLTNGSSDFDDDMSEQEASQSLPAPFVPKSQTTAAGLRRTVSEGTKRSQPIGILKDANPSRLNSQRQKTTRTTTRTEVEESRERDATTGSASGARKSRSEEANARKVSFDQPDLRMESELASEPEFTGRLSAKSDVSGMSVPSEISEVDKFQRRRNSDSVRFDLESEHEENMTSALFMDDITLEQRKTTERLNGKKTKSELSRDAKRVLDDLCHDHDCRNCIVCSRINSHQHGDGVSKKAVRVEKPVPVSDRAPTQSAYEDQSTIRPSQDPAVAIAKVIKALEDEERHLKNAIRKKNAIYNECDPSIHRRVWKKIGAEVEKLQKARDLKRDQIYFLYDAIEAFKQSGQEMTDNFAELTIMSAMSKDPTWNGVLDC
ncbi:hypothetical protein GGR52DRAFT_497969 [Hypoxylon sp. FL1284]|nr:hypothetical protein GGR52DRAFT_497969 [Hypoxylon sp. FL1284]